MPEFPKVKIVRNGSTAEVTVDGKPFPWHIAEGGVEVRVDRNQAPTVTLTLLCERVDVENSLT